MWHKSSIPPNMWMSCRGYLGLWVYFGFRLSVGLCTTTTSVVKHENFSRLKYINPSIKRNCWRCSIQVICKRSNLIPIVLNTDFTNFIKYSKCWTRIHILLLENKIVRGTFFSTLIAFPFFSSPKLNYKFLLLRTCYSILICIIKIIHVSEVLCQKILGEILKISKKSDWIQTL